ncbi:MAG: TrbI/VirB10 family protein [Desulfuromonadales bacterium]|nr:TrbI/VirB10 family protein [Desulfuromonadales bacterium]
MPDDDNQNQNPDNTPLPLDTPKLLVTGVKKKLVIILLAMLGTAAAISLIWSMSPNKTTQDESKSDSSPKRLPTLPETVIGSPNNYNEMKDKNAPNTGPQMAGSAEQLQLPQQRELEAGQALAAAGDGKSSYATYPVSSTNQQPQLSPAQQAAQNAAEQRKKELNDALRSGLSFGGGSTDSPQTGNQSSAPVPSIPGIENLDAMTRKIGAGLTGADDDQNRQQEKRSFVSEKKGNSPYLPAGLQPPLSRFELKAGSIIPSLLITGLNSDLPGQIVAQVRENVYDTVTGRYILIPQGTRLVGDYDSQVTYGQERAIIVWSRMIMPNGHSINLEGMPGVDMSGYSGIKDRVNNHYAKLLTGVVLGSVIGAGAQVATGGQGSANTPASFSQLAVSGAATTMNQAGQQITQRNLNLQPTIEIRPGLKLNVFVTKDVILKPYRRT